MREPYGDREPTSRFPQRQLPAGLARRVHQSTDGNPLFMVNVVDDLVARRGVGAIDGQRQFTARLEEVVLGVPESLRQIIVQQIERLPPREKVRRKKEGVGGVS